jgi:hypothetical protein
VQIFIHDHHRVEKPVNRRAERGQVLQGGCVIGVLQLRMQSFPAI